MLQPAPHSGRGGLKRPSPSRRVGYVKSKTAKKEKGGRSPDKLSRPQADHLIPPTANVCIAI